MNGIIIINKEKDWTSNDIVQKIKGMYHEKVGHTGTLDPQATGVLPILIGKGTGLSKYIINHNKEYIATVHLGQKTTTGDAEGDVIEEKPVTKEMLMNDNVIKNISNLIGKQEQTPPMYSAIKVNGKKLYEYARKGQEVQVKARQIEIYETKLIAVSEESQDIIFRVKCSKGTYIRTLCEKLAEQIGTVGFMKELNRTEVGDFKIEKSIKISELINLDKEQLLQSKSFISIEDFLKENGKIILSKDKMIKFLNGVKINTKEDFGIYRIYDENGNFVGCGETKDNKVKRGIII